jgi:uncharacterized membrane protein
VAVKPPTNADFTWIGDPKVSATIGRWSMVTPDSAGGGPSRVEALAAARRPYIDWARALALLVMIEAHTTDAWTLAVARQTAAFRHAMILGGFAAPLFLWLAGVSLVLSAASVARREGSRAAAVDAVCRRGLEIFLLAFLFRLQSFVVTPGGNLVSLFRVDILNIMGPSIAAAGLVWGLARTTKGLVALYATMAIALSMLTPVVRASALVNDLPTWVQWYFRPAGGYTTFTALPWAGFVFAGAAVGALLAPFHEAAREHRLQMWLAGAGGVLVGAGFYAATLPTIYRDSSFWTTSPTFFMIRVGTLMLAFAAIYTLAQLAGRRGIELRPLSRFGRSSLFVYWIHVELVYGYLSGPLHARLPLWGALVAYTLFTTLMYGAVVLKDRIVARWTGRRRARRAPQPAAAW